MVSKYKQDLKIEELKVKRELMKEVKKILKEQEEEELKKLI
jgi:hypothetical protein